MFDGTLFSGEPKRDERGFDPAPRAWSWPLVAMVVGIAALAVLTAWLWPDVVAYPAERF